MELGVGVPHTGGHASPSMIAAVAQRAEELGFQGLWTVDHVVMPAQSKSQYTLGRQPTVLPEGALPDTLAPNYESVSTLIWVAGQTSRIRLGTSIAVLPLRNPLLNAKMLSTLDALSGGRLLYGVGPGWLKEEADALQMPWSDRGRRTEEHIALLRHVWTAEGPFVSFEGEFYRFKDIHVDPRPVQQPPPILIGGHSGVALSRAGRVGDGWIAAPMSPERLATCWAQVLRAAEEADRPPAALMLKATFTIPLTDDPRSPFAVDDDSIHRGLDAYRSAGVDHLTANLTGGTPDSRLSGLESLATRFLPGLLDESAHKGDRQ